MPKRKRTHAAPPSTRTSRNVAEVVHLAEFRQRRRLGTYQQKISSVLESNRRAIGRLYATGALFSRQGARAGRDLLLAHQHLLRVVALLEQLSDTGEVPAPKNPDRVGAVYRELDLLLDRTTALTSRTGEYLAFLKRD